MSTNETPYRSASYLPCTSCGEGAIVWDAELEASRCSACGERDQ